MGEGKPLTVAQGDEWQGNLACECFACTLLSTGQYSCMHRSKVHADKRQETCNAEGTPELAVQTCGESLHKGVIMQVKGWNGKGSNLFCKLLYEDEGSNEHISICHVLGEGCIVAGISQLFQQVTHNLHADIAAVGIDVLNCLSKS